MAAPGDHELPCCETVGVGLPELGFLVVSLLSWVVPILLIVYLFRTLGVIVDGLRSINAASQRIAAAVEQLVANQQPGGPGDSPPPTTA